MPMKRKATKAAEAAVAALPPIPKELIDQFVTGPMSAEAVQAASMAFKKALIERALGGELSHHLGYPPGGGKPAEARNHRNGASAKTVLTDDGPVRIDVPRDRQGSFEPVLIPKHERRFTGFDDKIVALYARGMTVREIQGFLAEQYGTEVSPEFIGSVTDAVLAEVGAWQARPLVPMYPVVFFDALRVRIREDGHLRHTEERRRSQAWRQSISNVGQPATINVGHTLHLRQQARIALRSRAQQRRVALARRVAPVRRRGNPQRAGLDPATSAVLVDEGVHFLSWRSNSAWAKYALASFRISLVLRSSRTSRSSCLIRCWSAVVAPGRKPLSRSPWRTHLRSVLAVQPILPAIDSIAAHCDEYWSLASKTMRTARSITSGEYFGDFLMLAPFSIEGASSKAGAVHFSTMPFSQPAGTLQKSGSNGISWPCEG
jgi:hypothetical protein